MLKRFVDESGIRERYERYIAKAAIDGTINYIPISFHELFNLLYTLNEKTLNKSGIIFAGITTILAADDASALDCVTVAQSHLFTNRNRYSGKIYASYVIRRSNTSYFLCGSAYCMFNFITIIKPTIIPSIRRVRDGLLFCEQYSTNPIRLIWLGYKCIRLHEQQ